MLEQFKIRNVVHKPDLIKLARDYIDVSRVGRYHYYYDDDDYDDWYDPSYLYDRYYYGNAYHPLYGDVMNGGYRSALNDKENNTKTDDVDDVSDLNIVLDTDDNGFKEIYFYSNIELGDDPDEHFSSLNELKEYCESMGISIGVDLYESLRTESLIHCCINPVDRKYGELNLIVDYSYGNLYWKCMDELEDDYELGGIRSGYFDDEGNYISPGDAASKYELPF